MAILQYKNITEFRAIQKYLLEHKEKVEEFLRGAALLDMTIKEFDYCQFITRPACYLIYREKGTTDFFAMSAALKKLNSGEVVLVYGYRFRLNMSPPHTGYYGETIREIHSGYTIIHPVKNSKFNRQQVVNALLLASENYADFFAIANRKVALSPSDVVIRSNSAGAEAEITASPTYKIHGHIICHLCGELVTVAEKVDKMTLDYDFYIRFGNTIYLPITLEG